MPETDHPSMPEPFMEMRAARLVEHVSELFRLSEHRFGGCFLRGEETNEPHAFLDKARYQGETQLVTVNPQDFSIYNGTIDTAAPIDVCVDTAIPSVDSWPNSYLRECFLFNQIDECRTGLEPFERTLMVYEFTPDGKSIAGKDSVGLAAELERPISDDDMEQGIAQLLDAEAPQATEVYSPQNRKLAAMRRLFPEMVARFEASSPSERFEELFRLVMALTPRAEVGCEPNPYARA
jgi:hypothetical protein